MGQERQDASLYIHIPFCTQRCSYCDFFFVTSKHGHSEFVDALCLEIRQVARNHPNQSLSTVYFGGGTPSRLHSHAIHKILSSIHACFELDQVCELTLEANPEDVCADSLEILLEIGITRISLGVQSFMDRDLTFMNRCHNSAQAFYACNLIRSTGFTSWSLDLIFGIPDASMSDWEKNLHHAIETGVPHISTYSLTIEPNTPLHKQVDRGKVTPASDSRTRDQFQRATEILNDAGFEHYEISSFARPGQRSRHNTRYWHHMNYFGVGPSAHSFLWQNGQALRWENIRNLRTYSELVTAGKSPIHFKERLSIQDLTREKIMLALRTSEGLDLQNLQSTYGFSLSRHKRKELDTMESNGLITWHGSSIRLTPKGMHICDHLTRQLWPD